MKKSGNNSKSKLNAYVKQKQLRLTVKVSASNVFNSVLTYDKGIAEKFRHCNAALFRFIKEAAGGGYTYLDPHFADKIYKVISLDYNSAYPKAMHDCLLPCEEPKISDKNISESYIYDDSEYMIARIKINKNCYLKQFHPPTVRNEISESAQIDYGKFSLDVNTVVIDRMFNDKSDFSNNYLEYVPRGTLRVMSKPDIRNLLKSYDINFNDIEFLEVYIAKTSDKLFKKYIEHFYKIKTEQKIYDLTDDERFNQLLYNRSKISLPVALN